MKKRYGILVGCILTVALLPAIARTHLEMRMEVPCAPGMTSFTLPGEAAPARPVCVSTDLILDESGIARVVGGTDPRTGAPIAIVIFNKAGQAQFAAATRQNVGHRMAIWFNGAVISAPFISEPILGGMVQITGPADGIAALLAAFQNGPSPT
jgi:preprotein translocase subunit SecD